MKYRPKFRVSVLRGKREIIDLDVTIYMKPNHVVGLRFTHNDVPLYECDWKYGWIYDSYELRLYDVDCLVHGRQAEHLNHWIEAQLIKCYARAIENGDFGESDT